MAYRRTIHGRRRQGRPAPAGPYIEPPQPDPDQVVGAQLPHSSAAMMRVRAAARHGISRLAWVVGWTVAATVVLLAVVAAGTLLTFAINPGPTLPFVIAAAAPVVLLAGSALLRSASRLAYVLATAGALFLGLFAPMYAADQVLAVEGRTIVATVSKVDTTSDRHGTINTAWLTDAAGNPIQRPLATSDPWQVGEQVRVVFDPHGLVPTETPAMVARSWPLPATVASALVMIAGLAIMIGGHRRTR